MPQGDLYEVVLKGTLKEQDITNVFHYHQALAFVPLDPTYAQVLATQFIAQKLPSIRGIATGDLVYQEVSVRNLFDASDSYAEPISLAGSFATAASNIATTFVAMAFQLQGDNAAVGKGAKRFAGVPADQLTDGVATGGTYVTALNAVAAAIEGPVTVGLVIQDPVFQPVVIKRVRTGTPGNYTYNLPTSSLQAVFSNVTVALWKALAASQLSRKIGVGV